MKNQINIFQGERASNYDQFVQEWIPNYDYIIQKLPNILQTVEPNKILIAGCGTGNEILALAETNAHWSITGVDPSPEMIAIAKDKLSSLTNINLIEGEVKQLPETELYDATTLFLVLHFIKDDGSKLQILKDIAVRLRPGGMLLILDIFGNKKDLIKNLDILTAILPNSIPEDEIQKRVDRIKNKLYHITENRLSQLLVNAGFENPHRFYQTSIYGGWITKRI